MTTKVIRIEIGKDQLLAMSEIERTFFITLGHISNEINALTKLMYWAANTPAVENTPQDHGRFTFGLLLIQLLAGKLNEAWLFFSQKFFGTAFAKDYEPKLDIEIAKNLKSLKRYFGKRNSAFLIRNNFAFHYSSTEITATLPKITDQLFLYLDRGTATNNLFYLSETVLSQALLELLTLDPQDDPYPALVEELFEVSLWFTLVSDGIMEAIIMNNNELRIADPEVVHFEELQSFSNIRLPWFTETQPIE